MSSPHLSFLDGGTLNNLSFLFKQTVRDCDHITSQLKKTEYFLRRLIQDSKVFQN